MNFLWGFLILVIVIVAILIVFKKLRPLFPVKVNCWFCDRDTQVPFGNRNCWDCPHCDQYNGFTPDGDYNKPVPAQYTEEINHPVNCEPTEFLTRSQFLCHACQRNQLLKVKQLAAFEPLNEATYDEEMSFYKRHLEKVYALCPLCDAVVKRGLERQDDSLRPQSDIPKDTPGPTDSWAEAEATTALHKVTPILQLLPWVMSVITSMCTVVLVGRGVEDYYRSDDSRGDMQHDRLAQELTRKVDRLGIGLCGLLLCMLSKLLHGKDRLRVGDAGHIVLWLGVVLVGRFLSPHPLDLCLPVLLLTLELSLFLRHRRPSNVTAPIMKRLSLEGGASAANSDAVSEAVSSVSTSGRQRQTSPFSDSGDGPGTPLLNTLTREQLSARGTATTQGVLVDGTHEGVGKSGVLDDLGKGFGAILIGPHSSGESGYSSGKSSVFSSKAFGPVTQPTFSGGVSFPRPLLQPPRLSVVSFSQPMCAGRSSLWSQPGPLFDGVKEQSPSNKAGHVNPFLVQDSRPLSMFSPRKDKPLSNIFNLASKPWTPSRSSALFCTTNTPRTIVTPKAASGSSAFFCTTNTPRTIVTPKAASGSSALFCTTNTPRTTVTPKAASGSSALFCTTNTPGIIVKPKAASEVNFPVHGAKHSHSKTPTTWWRSSSSAILESRHDLADICESKDVQSHEADSSEDRSRDVTNAFTSMGDKLLSLPVLPKECDSTTPLLSQLKISSAVSKKRKKKASKQQMKEVADTFMFSADDEESPVPLPSPSTVSTVVLQTKQDWGWLQWLCVAVMVVSVFINLFLAWNVGSPRP
ncbi:hypothetical protein ACOMHN_028987 [Nucella lapillus]